MSITIMSQCWGLRLPTTDLLVLLALADRADDDGFCWPSIETLALKIGGEDQQEKGWENDRRRMVQRALKSLEEQGHLSRKMRPGNSTEYCIHPVRNEETIARQAPDEVRAKSLLRSRHLPMKGAARRSPPLPFEGATPVSPPVSEGVTYESRGGDICAPNTSKILTPPIIPHSDSQLSARADADAGRQRKRESVTVTADAADTSNCSAGGAGPIGFVKPDETDACVELRQRWHRLFEVAGSPATYRSWLDPMRLQISGDRIRLIARTPFDAAWVRDNLIGRLTPPARGLFGANAQIEVGHAQ